jgi:DNA-binding NarL/FixJ family response regulator
MGNAVKPPPGLQVELVHGEDDTDEEFGVFVWDTDAAPPVPALTTAEAAVLRELVAGRSNAEIAKLRSTSARTIANQVAALLRKLGATSRYELIQRFGGGDGDGAARG